MERTRELEELPVSAEHCPRWIFTATEGAISSQKWAYDWNKIRAKWHPQYFFRWNDVDYDGYHPEDYHMQMESGKVDCVIDGMFNSKEEDTESGSSSSTGAVNGRCRCTVLLVAIGILLIAAITIPLVFFILSPEEKSNELVGNVSAELSLAKINYTDEMLNKSSAEFQLLSEIFELEMKNLYANSSLQNDFIRCQVKNITKGPRVHYEMIFDIINRRIPSTNQIKDILNAVERDENDTTLGVLGDLRFKIDTVHIKDKTLISKNQIKERIPTSVINNRKKDGLHERGDNTDKGDNKKIDIHINQGNTGPTDSKELREQSIESTTFINTNITSETLPTFNIIQNREDLTTTNVIDEGIVHDSIQIDVHNILANNELTEHTVKELEIPVLENKTVKQIFDKTEIKGGEESTHAHYEVTSKAYVEEINTVRYITSTPSSSIDAATLRTNDNNYNATKDTINTLTRQLESSTTVFNDSGQGTADIAISTGFINTATLSPKENVSHKAIPANQKDSNISVDESTTTGKTLEFESTTKVHNIPIESSSFASDHLSSTPDYFYDYVTVTDNASTYKPNSNITISNEVNIFNNSDHTQSNVSEIEKSKDKNEETTHDILSDASITKVTNTGDFTEHYKYKTENRFYGLNGSVFDTMFSSTIHLTDVHQDNIMSNMTETQIVTDLPNTSLVVATGDKTTESLPKTESAFTEVNTELIRSSEDLTYLLGGNKQNWNNMGNVWSDSSTRVNVTEEISTSNKQYPYSLNPLVIDAYTTKKYTTDMVGKTITGMTNVEITTDPLTKSDREYIETFDEGKEASLKILSDERKDNMRYNTTIYNSISTSENTSQPFLESKFTTNQPLVIADSATRTTFKSLSRTNNIMESVNISTISETISLKAPVNVSFFDIPAVKHESDINSAVPAYAKSLNTTAVTSKYSIALRSNTTASKNKMLKRNEDITIFRTPPVNVAVTNKTLENTILAFQKNKTRVYGTDFDETTPEHITYTNMTNKTATTPISPKDEKEHAKTVLVAYDRTLYNGTVGSSTRSKSISTNITINGSVDAVSADNDASFLYEYVYDTVTVEAISGPNSKQIKDDSAFEKVSVEPITITKGTKSTMYTNAHDNKVSLTSDANISYVDNIAGMKFRHIYDTNNTRYTNNELNESVTVSSTNDTKYVYNSTIDGIETMSLPNITKVIASDMGTTETPTAFVNTTNDTTVGRAKTTPSLLFAITTFEPNEIDTKTATKVPLQTISVTNSSSILYESASEKDNPFTFDGKTSPSNLFETTTFEPSTYSSARWNYSLHEKIIDKPKFVTPHPKVSYNSELISTTMQSISISNHSVHTDQNVFDEETGKPLLVTHYTERSHNQDVVDSSTLSYDTKMINETTVDELKHLYVTTVQIDKELNTTIDHRLFETNDSSLSSHSEKVTKDYLFSTNYTEHPTDYELNTTTVDSINGRNISTTNSNNIDKPTYQYTNGMKYKDMPQESGLKAATVDSSVFNYEELEMYETTDIPSSEANKTQFIPKSKLNTEIVQHFSILNNETLSNIKSFDEINRDPTTAANYSEIARNIGLHETIIEPITINKSVSSINVTLNEDSKINITSRKNDSVIDDVPAESIAIIDHTDFSRDGYVDRETEATTSTYMMPGWTKFTSKIIYNKSSIENISVTNYSHISFATDFGKTIVDPIFVKNRTTYIEKDNITDESLSSMYVTNTPNVTGFNDKNANGNIYELTTQKYDISPTSYTAFDRQDGHVSTVTNTAKRSELITKKETTQSSDSTRTKIEIEPDTVSTHTILVHDIDVMSFNNTKMTDSAITTAPNLKSVSMTSTLPSFGSYLHDNIQHDTTYATRYSTETDINTLKSEKSDMQPFFENTSTTKTHSKMITTEYVYENNTLLNDKKYLEMISDNLPSSISEQTSQETNMSSLLREKTFDKNYQTTSALTLIDLKQNSRPSNKTTTIATLNESVEEYNKDSLKNESTAETTLGIYTSQSTEDSIDINLVSKTPTSNNTNIFSKTYLSKKSPSNTKTNSDYPNVIYIPPLRKLYNSATTTEGSFITEEPNSKSKKYDPKILYVSPLPEVTTENSSEYIQSINVIPQNMFNDILYMTPEKRLSTTSILSSVDGSEGSLQQRSYYTDVNNSSQNPHSLHTTTIATYNITLNDTNPNEEIFISQKNKTNIEIANDNRKEIEQKYSKTLDDDHVTTIESTDDTRNLHISSSTDQTTSTTGTTNKSSLNGKDNDITTVMINFDKQTEDLTSKINYREPLSSTNEQMLTSSILSSNAAAWNTRFGLLKTMHFLPTTPQYKSIDRGTVPILPDLPYIASFPLQNYFRSVISTEESITNPTTISPYNGSPSQYISELSSTERTYMADNIYNAEATTPLLRTKISTRVNVTEEISTSNKQYPYSLNPLVIDAYTTKSYTTDMVGKTITGMTNVEITTDPLTKSDREYIETFDEGKDASLKILSDGRKDNMIYNTTTYNSISTPESSSQPFLESKFTTNQPLVKADSATKTTFKSLSGTNNIMESVNISTISETISLKAPVNVSFFDISAVKHESDKNSAVPAYDNSLNTTAVTSKYSIALRSNTTASNIKMLKRNEELTTNSTFFDSGSSVTQNTDVTTFRTLHVDVAVTNKTLENTTLAFRNNKTHVYGTDFDETTPEHITYKNMTNKTSTTPIPPKDEKEHAETVEAYGRTLYDGTVGSSTPSKPISTNITINGSVSADNDASFLYEYVYDTVTVEAISSPVEISRETQLSEDVMNRTAKHENFSLNWFLMKNKHATSSDLTTPLSNFNRETSNNKPLFFTTKAPLYESKIFDVDGNAELTMLNSTDTYTENKGKPMYRKHVIKIKEKFFLQNSSGSTDTDMPIGLSETLEKTKKLTTSFKDRTDNMPYMTHKPLSTSKVPIYRSTEHVLKVSGSKEKEQSNTNQTFKYLWDLGESDVLRNNFISSTSLASLLMPTSSVSTFSRNRKHQSVNDDNVLKPSSIRTKFQYLWDLGDSNLQQKHYPTERPIVSLTNTTSSVNVSSTSDTVSPPSSDIRYLWSLGNNVLSSLLGDMTAKQSDTELREEDALMMNNLLAESSSYTDNTKSTEKSVQKPKEIFLAYNNPDEKLLFVGKVPSYDQNHAKKQVSTTTTARPYEIKDKPEGNINASGGQKNGNYMETSESGVNVGYINTSVNQTYSGNNSASERLIYSKNTNGYDGQTYIGNTNASDSQTHDGNIDISGSESHVENTNKSAGKLYDDYMNTYDSQNYVGAFNSSKNQAHDGYINKSESDKYDRQMNTSKNQIYGGDMNKSENDTYGRQKDASENQTYGSYINKSESDIYGLQIDTSEHQIYGVYINKSESDIYGHQIDASENQTYGSYINKSESDIYGRQIDTSENQTYGGYINTSESDTYGRQKDTSENQIYGGYVNKSESDAYSRQIDASGNPTSSGYINKSESDAYSRQIDASGNPTSSGYMNKSESDAYSRQIDASKNPTSRGYINKSESDKYGHYIDASENSYDKGTFDNYINISDSQSENGKTSDIHSYGGYINATDGKNHDNFINASKSKVDAEYLNAYNNETYGIRSNNPHSKNYVSGSKYSQDESRNANASGIQMHGNTANDSEWFLPGNTFNYTFNQVNNQLDSDRENVTNWYRFVNNSNNKGNFSAYGPYNYDITRNETNLLIQTNFSVSNEQYGEMSRLWMKSNSSLYRNDSSFANKTESNIHKHLWNSNIQNHNQFVTPSSDFSASSTIGHVLENDGNKTLEGIIFQGSFSENSTNLEVTPRRPDILTVSSNDTGYPVILYWQSEEPYIGSALTMAWNVENIGGWKRITLTRQFTSGKSETIATIREHTMAISYGNSTLFVSPKTIFDQTSATVYLDMRAIKCEDEAVYTLLVTSDIGKIERQTYLHVLRGPTIKIVSPKQIFSDETLDSIKCEADIGYPYGKIVMRVSYDGGVDFENYFVPREMMDVQLSEACREIVSVNFTGFFNRALQENLTRVQCGIHDSNAIRPKDGYKMSIEKPVEVISANICEMNGSTPHLIGNPYETCGYIECPQRSLNTCPVSTCFDRVLSRCK